MREMLAIIARGIEPTAVDVRGVGRAIKFQIVIGLVQQAGTALPLETGDDVEQGIFLQQITLDLETETSAPRLCWWRIR